MVAGILLALTLSPACSRPPIENSDGDTPAASEQPLPFDRGPTQRAISPTQSVSLREIPAGTVLVAKLLSSAGIALCHPGNVLRATLDNSVQIHGRIVIPKGAVLMGSVAGCRTAGNPDRPAFLRLELNRLVLDNNVLPIKTTAVLIKNVPDSIMGDGSQKTTTSSSRASGRRPSLLLRAEDLPAGKRDRRNMGFSPDHRFNFRLVDPVSLP